MTSLWEILALGLLLGVRHALDPDHLVAVTTIVSEYKNPLRAVWVGISWGLGHTVILLLVGGALLALGVRIPQTLSVIFQWAVGGLLVALGLQTFLSFRIRKAHIHLHVHGEGDEGASWLHRHFHLHEAGPGHQHHVAEEPGVGKPFFRPKSFVVGLVNGLGGSAAIMLLALMDIRSFWAGLAYMLAFGLGGIAAMGAISAFISLPFSASGRMPRLNSFIRVGAGMFSIAFGLVLMFQIGAR